MCEFRRLATPSRSRAINELRPSLPGASLEVTGSRRPPMEPSTKPCAFRRTHELGALLDLDIDDAGIVGGSSDANLTSALTPTLDGLGAIGDGAHAPDERIVVSSLARRAALLALLVLEPAPESVRRRPRRKATSPRVVVLGSPMNETNLRLLEAWPRFGVTSSSYPRERRARGFTGASVLGRPTSADARRVERGCSSSCCWSGPVSPS